MNRLNLDLGFKFDLIAIILSRYQSKKTDFAQSEQSRSLESMCEGLIAQVPNQIEIDSPIIGRLNMCWSALLDYFNDDRNAGKTMYRTIWKSFENYLLDNNLNLRFSADHVENSAMHRLFFFTEPIRVAIREFEPRRTRHLPQAICDALIVEPLLFLLCIALSVFNVVVCSLFSLLEALTRKPAEIDQLKEMVSNLDQFPEERRPALIAQVVASYNQRYIRSSSSSKELMTFLQMGEFSINAKWQKLISYMIRRDGDYFHNNGKLLFNIICDALQAPEISSIVQPQLP